MSEESEMIIKPENQKWTHLEIKSIKSKKEFKNRISQPKKLEAIVFFLYLETV